jgi:prepilin-type N-terminal cleavage/methylation domain-containing protein
MTPTNIWRNERGFTLIELIVVVIILAILAAVIIPQLQGSTEDAKLSTLDTDLSATRSAIELYYVQHGNTYPGTVLNDTVSGATAAHASAAAAFVAQMTKYSDANGNTSDVRDATFKFGPYMKKGVPKNPLPNSATTTEAAAKTVTVDTATTTLGTVSANDATASGWVFVRTTGEFIANNTTYASR